MYTWHMKLIWSPAVTLDGNIATVDGNSDWPTDTDGAQFHKLISECGAVIVGRRTFEQYKGKVFPVEGATTFVWTTQPEIGQHYGNVQYVSGSPKEIIKIVMEKGFSRCVLAGGTRTNNAFVSADLVDEISATIYPLLLGMGMGLLTLEDFEQQLELLETSQIGDGVIRNRYKVLKKNPK